MFKIIFIFAIPLSYLLLKFKTANFITRKSEVPNRYHVVKTIKDLFVIAKIVSPKHILTLD